ncbi:hypothetical protein [Streptomyces mexicanus]|uniref:hypothetical protein n=1 Tax=Streptomyces mexicanus TaxID=178566 RepID=UPI001F2D52BE|nr:hypothetical protein [Streptomyces mexicanus]
MATLVPQQVREKLDEMLEQMETQEPAEPTPEQLEQSRAQMLRHFAAWPEPVREPLVTRHLATWRVASRENRNLYDEVASEFRQAPTTPDVPLIVLTAMGHDATQAHLWPAELLREITRASAPCMPSWPPSPRAASRESSTTRGTGGCTRSGRTR